MSVKKDGNLHTSVLLDETIESLDICASKKNIVVDCTLWLAGHASEVIKKMKSWDIFIGFDADERNLKIAKQKLKHIQTQTKSSPEVVLVHSNFLHLRKELKRHNIETITAIYYDLGVSSVHFDETDRGFSFRSDGPLDMRFDTTKWQTAADALNYYEEKKLFEILRNYGEEPHARKIAARIITARKKQKFHTTWDLSDFLENEINTHIKTKMRVFQALRIEVNKELENLNSSLTQALELLSPKWIIAVISFHSLEDRIAKQVFKRETRDCICTAPICNCGHKKSLKILTKKPIIPTDIEQKENSRSRSAKLRIAEKL